MRITVFSLPQLAIKRYKLSPRTKVNKMHETLNYHCPANCGKVMLAVVFVLRLLSTATSETVKR
jgi:hypothetical protein